MISPALGPSSRIQAITEMKFGMTKAISTATRTNCRPGMAVRATAHAIGSAMMSESTVVATLTMRELTERGDQARLGQHAAIVRQRERAVLGAQPDIEQNAERIEHEPADGRATAAIMIRLRSHSCRRPSRPRAKRARGDGGGRWARSLASSASGGEGEVGAIGTCCRHHDVSASRTRKSWR